MIVDEEKVALGLDYLNIVPHPLALARKDLVDSENKARREFARAFLAVNEGSVEARKAKAELSPEYVRAKVEEAQAIFELETHRARVKGAELLLEIFRTEAANIRAAERIR